MRQYVPHPYIEDVRDANHLEDFLTGRVVVAAEVEKVFEDGRWDGAGELRVLRRERGGAMAAHGAHHAIFNLRWCCEGTAVRWCIRTS